MCGRTALAASPEDLREIFGLEETPRVTPHYNVPPSQPLAVVRVMRGGGRKMETLRWGLVPFWAEDEAIGHRLSLARVNDPRHDDARCIEESAPPQQSLF